MLNRFQKSGNNNLKTVSQTQGLPQPSPSNFNQSQHQQKLLQTEEDDSLKIKIQNKNLAHKKNLTNGKMQLIIADQDKVPDDFYQDSRDYKYEIFDQEPKTTFNYLENMKSGSFGKVQNKTIKKVMEKQQEDQAEIVPALDDENIINMINDFNDYLGKMFLIVQGLLSGFTIMHLFLLYLNTNDLLALQSYAGGCIRINQLLQILSFLSFLESTVQWVVTTQREQVFYGDTRCVMIMICFGFTYVLNTYNHEYAMNMSYRYSDFTTTYDEIKSKSSFYVISNLLMTILTLFGWTLIVSNLKIEKDKFDYDTQEEEEDLEEDYED